jgi:hypothetical protein
MKYQAIFFDKDGIITSSHYDSEPSETELCELMTSVNADTCEVYYDKYHTNECDILFYTLNTKNEK